MRKIIFLFLALIFQVASAENDNSYPPTIWEQLPKSTTERFNFFKKIDRTGMFELYENMRGTKLIFACVNAYVFCIFPFQRDDIQNINQAKDIAEKQCSEKRSPFKDSIDNENLKDLQIPLGTPILLDFHLDQDANDAYNRLKSDWKQVLFDDESQEFIYRKNIETNKKHIKASWMIENFSKGRLKTVVSIKYIKEIDCKRMKSRMSSVIAYKGKYGTGEVIERSDRKSRWYDIVPGSSGEEIANIICTR